MRKHFNDRLNGTNIRLQHYSILQHTAITNTRPSSVRGQQGWQIRQEKRMKSCQHHICPWIRMSGEFAYCYRLAASFWQRDPMESIHASFVFGIGYSCEMWDWIWFILPTALIDCLGFIWADGTYEFKTTGINPSYIPQWVCLASFGFQVGKDSKRLAIPKYNPSYSTIVSTVMMGGSFLGTL